MSKRKLLYIQLADDLKRDILEGVYPVDELIPTERELEERYGVSKITVRNAIEILSNDGYVEKKSGIGTRVISNRLFNTLSKVRSFSDYLEEKHNLKKEIISFGEYSPEVDSLVYKKLGSTVYRLERTYTLNQQPYLYFVHYFPVVDLDANLDKIKNESLYKWLAAHGMEVTYFRDSFKVALLNDHLKEFLNTSDSHVLLRTREAFDESGKLIEISEGYYDSFKMPYVIEYSV